MSVSNLIKSVAVAAIAFGILMLPGMLAAQAPTKPDPARISPSGNYLAARQASQQRDAAAASTYYRAALRADPKNPELLDRAFIASLDYAASRLTRNLASTLRPQAPASPR